MSIVGITGAGSPAAIPETGKTNDTSSLDRKMEQLQKQLEQIKKNQKLPKDEKEKRIAKIEKQIAQLKQRKRKEGMELSSADRKKRFDTYEKQPLQQSAGVYKAAQDGAKQDVVSLKDVPTLLPPSERGGEYTEQDALRSQYMKQVRLEGYFAGEEFIQTSEGPGRLVLLQGIAAEELEQFRAELEESGLGEAIDWRGVENDLVQMGVGFENAERFEQKVDYLASRYAVLKERIQSQYTGEAQASEMQKLEQIYTTAKEEMANAYAESIGGFYEDLGQTGAANDMRESVLAAVDGKTDEYSAYLAQNDIYGAITGTEKQWLKQDDAYMAAQLREGASAQQVETEPQAATGQATYSVTDLQLAGVYASERSNQVEEILTSAGVSFGEWRLSDVEGNDNSLGDILAEQYQAMLETVANAGMSDRAAERIKQSFEPFIEMFLNALDAKIDENRAQSSKDAWQAGLIRTQYIDRDSVYHAFQGALHGQV